MFTATPGPRFVTGRKTPGATLAVECFPRAALQSALGAGTTRGHWFASAMRRSSVIWRAAASTLERVTVTSLNVTAARASVPIATNASQKCQLHPCQAFAPVARNTAKRTTDAAAAATAQVRRVTFIRESRSVDPDGFGTDASATAKTPPKTPESAVIRGTVDGRDGCRVLAQRCGLAPRSGLTGALPLDQVVKVRILAPQPRARAVRARGLQRHIGACMDRRQRGGNARPDVYAEAGSRVSARAM